MAVLKNIGKKTVKYWRATWKRSKSGFVLMVAIEGVKIYVWYRVIRWVIGKLR